MRTMQAVLLLAACVAVASAASANLQMQDTPADAGTMRMLPPFSGIAADVPFNVLVMPGNYSVKVAADKPVADALVTNVTNGVLQLQLKRNASFTTNKPIKVTVMLPAGNLTSANVTGAFSLIVGSGFSATNFSAVAREFSFVSVTNITATNCVVTARGTSQAFVDGTCNTADVSATGVSSAYVGNVTTNATANAGGTSDISIKAANKNLTITAALSGISSVTYNQGLCQGGGSFLSTCDLGPVRTPRLTDRWTCGLKVVDARRGLWTPDGQVLNTNGNKQVRDRNGVTLVTSQRCDAFAPAAAPAMAPAAAAAAMDAPMAARWSPRPRRACP